MTTRRARAMLIGIEEYKRLGTDKHLRAGRNDVLAFWKVCRRLGFDPQNIHVFTTPVLTQQDLLWAELEIRDELPERKNADEIEEMVESWFPPYGERPKVVLEEATRANIMGPEGLDWIAKRVAGPGEPPVDRILTYSGHGARLENTLALCPSDVRQEGALQNAILIDDFKEALQDVDDNLTVVLDCCFAQTAHRPSGAHRHASISAGVADKPLSVDLGELGPRVFCASGPNESSYQALLGGYWYSAFSWAMTVVLEQWRICGKHKPHSTISHNELLSRIHLLLQALSFPQTPVLLGHASDKPVFGHLLDEEARATPEPNKERHTGQTDPSTKCAITCLKFYDSSGVLIAETIIPRDNVGEFSKDNEYWYLRQNEYTSVGTQKNITIQCTGYDSVPALEGAPRVLQQRAAWYGAKRMPNVAGQYTRSDGTTVKFGLSITISTVDGVRGLVLSWFHGLQNNVAAFTAVEKNQTTTITLSPYSSTTGDTWFIAQ